MYCVLVLPRVHCPASRDSGADLGVCQCAGQGSVSVMTTSLVNTDVWDTALGLQCG